MGMFNHIKGYLGCVYWNIKGFLGCVYWNRWVLFGYCGVLLGSCGLYIGVGKSLWLLLAVGVFALWDTRAGYNTFYFYLRAKQQLADGVKKSTLTHNPEDDYDYDYEVGVKVAIREHEAR